MHRHLIRAVLILTAALGTSVAYGSGHGPAPVSAVQQQKGSCYSSGLRSPSSTVKATAHVTNKRSGVMNAFWVDFEGNRKFYKSIVPGETWDVDSYVGHIWVITNSSGACTSVWTIDRTDGTYITP